MEVRRIDNHFGLGDLAARKELQDAVGSFVEKLQHISTDHAALRDHDNQERIFSEINNRAFDSNHPHYGAKHFPEARSQAEDAEEFVLLTGEEETLIDALLTQAEEADEGVSEDPLEGEQITPEESAALTNALRQAAGLPRVEPVKAPRATKPKAK